jgi:hypothetical protein
LRVGLRLPDRVLVNEAFTGAARIVCASYMSGGTVAVIPGLIEMGATSGLTRLNLVLHHEFMMHVNTRNVFMRRSTFTLPRIPSFRARTHPGELPYPVTLTC